VLTFFLICLPLRASIWLDELKSSPYSFKITNISRCKNIGLLTEDVESKHIISVQPNTVEDIRLFLYKWINKKNQQ